MKKIVIAIGLVLLIISIGFTLHCRQKNTPTNHYSIVKSFVSQHIDTVIHDLALLTKAVKEKENKSRLELKFLNSRLSYKKIEGFIEYYFQGLNKRINGPALPDVKTDDNIVWKPAGFQVLEQYLYSNYNDSLSLQLIDEIKILQTDFNYIKSNWAVMNITKEHLAELIQHQLIRISTIGVTGADAPLSKLSLPEVKSALEGLSSICSIITKQPIANFSTATQYLSINTDFDTFNRLNFLTQHLMPLADSINAYIPLDTVVTNKPFYGTLTQFLQSKKFNPEYYIAYADGISNQFKISLGEKLFYDKSLSKSQTISCGSCHNPKLYFTDGLVKAKNFVHSGSLERNTPTLLYAALQNNQFYDMRSPYLEDQINEVIKNKDEFNISTTALAALCKKDTSYTTLFKKAFGKDTISSYFIRNAMAAYVRTLAPFNSAFDDYIRGDNAAMTVEQITGFNLFAGKAKCATCHFVPLFNGTIPPWLTKTESEIIGVPSTKVWQNATIDKDVGRYNLNALEELRYAFKTPTLRNVAKTAPYMHNGVYNSLDDVVTFYHKGGGVGIGINLPFQSLPFDSLQLNTTERKNIVLFMEALTDKK